MKRQCYRLPEKLDQEAKRLMNEFCRDDPDGDFIEAEWQKCFNANASPALKREVRREKRVYAATPPGVHI